MVAWETALTTRDTNRVVRPLEWGFDWLEGTLPWGERVGSEVGGREAGFPASAPLRAASGRNDTVEAGRDFGRKGTDPGTASGIAPGTGLGTASGIDSGIALGIAPGTTSTAVVEADELERMVALNEAIVARAGEFFSYERPTDFRLEMRHPQLFPTNVRPETLEQDAEFKRMAREGVLEEAEFLRFTSPVRTRFPENDVVNARWYPAPKQTAEDKAKRGTKPKQAGKNKPKQAERNKPKQAIIVLPQWNADAFSHNALCTLFNRFGISALRLSKPYHDIRRPAELERSDYAVSANVGRTIEACRQAAVDIRCCIDWLEQQGYEQFGVLGTSLGSCYAFIAAAHDPRIQVCAFNHASTWFGDVVWTGQSTRHIRQAFEEAGLTQETVRKIFTGISPMSYMDQFAASKSRRTLVVHATWDLTFLQEFSLDVLKNFDRCGVNYESRVLPCGHYTTGEAPYKYIDGWYLGSFVYRAFKKLAEEAIPSQS